MKNLPEIVSPAGNPEKLRFAVTYGANAVYFGGESFNLRFKAANFSPEDLAWSADFCREHGVRSVFLLNSYLHEQDLAAARTYVNEIKKYSFDAVMVSDPGMLTLVKEAGLGAQIHLSTQMSTLNHLAMRFWRDAGVDRIVLGRETTLDEIQSIREHTDIPVEVFAHGALCIAYSGRCLLSRYLTGRNANQGDCAHPCRWNYALIEKMRPGNFMDILEHENGTEILSSKDLCIIEKIHSYIDAGVDAFKIEGRMKSLYYGANTTRIYRHALHTPAGESEKYLPFWKEELDLVSHRPYTDDLFNEFDSLGFQEMPYITKVLFLGYSLSEETDDEIMVRVFNPIYLNEKIEAIFPIRESILDDSFTVREIVGDDNIRVDIARPSRIYRIRFDKPVAKHAIFRRRLQDKA